MLLTPSRSRSQDSSADKQEDNRLRMSYQSIALTLQRIKWLSGVLNAWKWMNEYELIMLLLHYKLRNATYCGHYQCLYEIQAPSINRSSVIEMQREKAIAEDGNRRAESALTLPHFLLLLHSCDMRLNPPHSLDLCSSVAEGWSASSEFRLLQQPPW